VWTTATLVLASSPKTITDELQWVLNAAACLISGTGKYDRGLSRLLHDELHWLDIPQQMQYKLAVTVHRCLRSQAPTYLADHCIPISEVAGHLHLRSARRQQLNVPRVRRVIGRRAFASAGPTIWNSLRDNLHDLTVELDQFQQELKTHLFACLLNTSSTVR